MSLFRKGERVMVTNLVSNVELNGEHGEVLFFNVEKQRYAVQLDEKKVLLNFKEKFGILDLKSAVNSKIELKQKKSKVQ